MAVYKKTCPDDLSNGIRAFQILSRFQIFCKTVKYKAEAASTDVLPVKRYKLITIPMLASFPAFETFILHITVRILLLLQFPSIYYH